MREVLWGLAGWLFGIGAARRARSVIIAAQSSGEAWFHGLAHRSSTFVPTGAMLGAAGGWAMARTFGGETATFAFVVFCTALIEQLLVDLDTHLLPRRRSRGATVLGAFLLGLASLVQWDISRWWWGVLGSFVSWLFFRAVRALSRGDLGGGDVTFAVLIGFHLGWIAIGNVVLFAFVTFVLGGAGGLVSLVRRRSLRGHFAFGPWMVAGAAITIVWEQNLRSFISG